MLQFPFPPPIAQAFGLPEREAIVSAADLVRNVALIRFSVQSKAPIVLLNGSNSAQSGVI